MAKQTKAQRIKGKLSEGKSHLEAEIEVAQEDAAAKIADLRAKQVREEAKVREAIVELLEDEHSELFESLEKKARRRLEDEVRRRRERSKGTVSPATPETAPASRVEIQREHHVQ